MRDWNTAIGKIRCGKLWIIAIISKPYEGLKLEKWSSDGCDPWGNCNYFKALWGIETQLEKLKAVKDWHCNYFKALWGIETRYRSPCPGKNRRYCNYFKALWGIETKTRRKSGTFVLGNCNYFKALWGIETITKIMIRLTIPLQLIESPMRDWNAPLATLAAPAKILLQLFQSFVRDSNLSVSKLNLPKINCNYFKALWGIETLV